MPRHPGADTGAAAIRRGIFREVCEVIRHDRRISMASLRHSIHREPHGAKEMAQHYLRDLVYGANDGIITTFAVVAGVAGGALSAQAVLIVGAANLIADGLSMGVGNYLGIPSQESAP